MENNQIGQDNQNNQAVNEPATNTQQPTVENTVAPTQPAQSAPPVPNESLVPKPKTANKLLLLGFIFLVFAVIIGGAYIYFQNQKEKIQNENPQAANLSETKVEEQISPTANPVQDPTADWEVYKSSVYQVKYPNGLISGGDESMLNISKWGPTQKEGTELFDGYAITFIQKEGLNVTPEEYAQTLIAEAESMGVSEITEEITDIKVNNYNGVTYTEEGLGTFKQIILASDNNSALVQISIIVADPGNLGFQKEVDQILSTLRFDSGQ